MTADHRFLLLFALLFSALTTLGVVTQRADSSSIARAAERASVSRLAPAPVTSLAPAGTTPSGALTPLLDVQLGTRYPDLALRLAERRSVLPHAQIVSYYGNPATASMGVLGSGDIEDVIAQLMRTANELDALNGPLDVVPALHLVYAVAQHHPASNGLYLQYTPEAGVLALLAAARANGMLLFIDLQIGRSTVDEEVRKVLPYLRQPDVHLALDPEFATGNGEVPGVDLGSLSALDVNEAQQALQQLVTDYGLPPKLLIVHQFADSMLPDRDAIRRYPGVDLIIDMDGFGLAAIKRAKYQEIASATRGVASPAIKLFFEHDIDLMGPAEVLALEPPPPLVIYQ